MRKIAHYKGISNTPAQLYALKAFVELFENGLTDGSTSPPCWEDNAITVYADNDPVKGIIGVLTWQKSEWQKCIIIRLGYVSGGFRKQGVYKMLWDEIVKTAKKEGMIMIDGFTHISNIAMRAAAKSQGREEFCVGFRYFIDGHPNG